MMTVDIPTKNGGIARKTDQRKKSRRFNVVAVDIELDRNLTTAKVLDARSPIRTRLRSAKVQDEDYDAKLTAIPILKSVKKTPHPRKRVQRIPLSEHDVPMTETVSPSTPEVIGCGPQNELPSFELAPEKSAASDDTVVDSVVRNYCSLL
ncbi:hypothetical protein CRM22_008217 [Opisthorchis felineus]|uniref:Uncharacterized protein n=1 Tax=Opisthorchis felineus TaxID=147828 RepID=A0A4S2LC57_OPIFE|nr:hypothetical protein CRM22_008217 [Opisthorchis felineus]